MIEKLSKEIENKLSDLITEVADEHLVGKPALLATGMYFNTEKFLIAKLNLIEETFNK